MTTISEFIASPALDETVVTNCPEYREKFLKFVPLDPWYRFYFHDGTTFDYCKSVKDTQKEIAKFSKNDALGYEKLLKISHEIFDIGFTKWGLQVWCRRHQVKFLHIDFGVHICIIVSLLLLLLNKLVESG